MTSSCITFLLCYIAGDCDGLQYAQSMEVDPKTGLMWIIDAGRLHTFTDEPIDVCPPKLVVWDVREGREAFRHQFPDEALGWESNTVNDIVVDPVDGRWAYMSDTGVGAETGQYNCKSPFDRRANAPVCDDSK